MACCLTTVGSPHVPPVRRALDKLRMDWEKAFVAMSPGSDVLRRLACELAAIEASGGNVELAHFDPEVLGALTDDELDALDALIEEEQR